MGNISQSVCEETCGKGAVGKEDQEGFGASEQPSFCSRPPTPGNSGGREMGNLCGLLRASLWCIGHVIKVHHAVIASTCLSSYPSRRTLAARTAPHHHRIMGRTLATPLTTLHSPWPPAIIFIRANVHCRQPGYGFRPTLSSVSRLFMLGLAGSRAGASSWSGPNTS